MKKQSLLTVSVFCLGLCLLGSLTLGEAFGATPMSQRLWQNIGEKELETFRKISQEIDQKNYDQALVSSFSLRKNYDRAHTSEQSKISRQNNDFYEAAASIILWKKYSENFNVKSVTFNDISRFTEESEFYPNIRDLRRNVERVAMYNDIPYQKTEKYFAKNTALSTESKLYLLKSKMDFLARLKANDAKAEELKQEIKDLISRIWIDENFTDLEAKNFLEKYGSQLTQHDHINRIDRLLWDGKNQEAKSLFYLVNEDYQSLFNAVLQIQETPKYIDNIVLSVPRRLRSNEGLNYRRILWLKAKDKYDDLLEAMLDLPQDTKYAQKWWSLRRLYSREMIKKKKYKTAYELVKFHNLPTTSSDFWEAEWMAGWISLRFLNEPKVAYRHFENLRNNVVQPVTLSRAIYWLGMSCEAMSKKEEAIKLYKEATKYPIFFYGQLAIHKHRSLDPIDAQYDIILPKDPEIKIADLDKMASSVAAKVAYLMMTSKEKNIANRNFAGKIFEYLIENAKSEGEVAIVMKLVGEAGERQLDARLARIAAKKNVFFIKDKFQIVQEVANDEHAPLVHAIIKQESGFAPLAVSHVGAIGFMQLMPETARLVAKDIGIPYSKEKLSGDIKYNVILGTSYIKKLINRFDGSEMLAIASYNAGPNATQRWINEFYDPRKETDIDRIVDWIELITYSETRNYVQRITENLIVYKYLMSRTNYDQIQ